MLTDKVKEIYHYFVKMEDTYLSLSREATEELLNEKTGAYEGLMGNK